MDVVLGLDDSFYQDKDETPARPDYRKAYAMGGRFAIHRLGQGIKPDPDYQINRDNSIEAGFLYGGYFVWDYTVGMSSQIGMVEMMLDDGRGDIPVSLDLERIPYTVNGVKYYRPLPPKENIYTAIETFVRAIYREENRYPMLYTNLDFLLHVIPDPPPLMLDMPLWLAAPGASIPPQRTGAYEKATFVQFDWHGDGIEWGMESGNVDLDYFLGDYAQLLEFCRRVPEEPTDHEKLKILWKEYKESHP